MQNISFEHKMIFLKNADTDEYLEFKQKQNFYIEDFNIIMFYLSTLQLYFQSLFDFSGILILPYNFSVFSFSRNPTIVFINIIFTEYFEEK
jgi:hypothetical protein